MAIPFRWRFSLRTLLLVTAILSAGIGLYLHQAQQNVVGLAEFLTIRRGPPWPAEDYAELKRQLLQRLKSQEFLAGVVSDPNVANLPILKEKANPADWINDRMEISFPHDSDILLVQVHMRKYREDSTQGIVLVNAILDQCYELSKEPPFDDGPMLPTRPWKSPLRVQIVKRATIITR